MSVLALALLPLVAPPSHAVVYGGNPGLHIHVDFPNHTLTLGDVELARVRLHSCAGPVWDTYPNAWIDPVDGWSMLMPAGDWCAVTLSWASDMALDGNAQGGTFELAFRGTSTYIPLAATIPAVSLSPFDVVSGVVYGGNPGLHLTIQ